MSAHQSVQRDERTVAVENTSYKWAYSFIAFALLIDVMFRAVVRHEAAWDLMALVVVGGAICAMHQARQKILGKTRVKFLVLLAFVSAVIAAVMAFVLTMRRAM